MSDEVLQIVQLGIDKVHPSGWNANVQSDEIFQELMEDIRKDGCDEPIIVVADPLKPGEYTIVSGEHRWKACRLLGYKTVPSVVKEGWDELTQKLKMVRRNLLRGHLEPHKFSKLVNDIKRVYDVPHTVLAREMGFENENEFLKHYMREKAQHDSAVQDIIKQTRHAGVIADDVRAAVNHVLLEGAETARKGFIMFAYHGKDHLLVRCDEDLAELLRRVAERIKDKDEDATRVFSEMLYQWLEG